MQLSVIIIFFAFPKFFAINLINNDGDLPKACFGSHSVEVSQALVQGDQDNLMTTWTRRLVIYEQSYSWDIASTENKLKLWNINAYRKF